MSEIQRYTCCPPPASSYQIMQADKNGAFVLYADHVADKAAAARAVRSTGEWNAAVEAAMQKCDGLHSAISDPIVIGVELAEAGHNTINACVKTIESLKRQPSEVSEQAVSLADEQILELAQDEQFEDAQAPAYCYSEAGILAFARALLRSAPPAAESIDEEAHEFNAKRLRRVVSMLGLNSAVPADDATLLGAMGSVLGMVARKLEEKEATAQPQAAPSTAVPEGWKWMAHPSRNGGKPIPVQFFIDEGVMCYRPFDDDSCEFEWDLRGDEWQEVAAPAQQVLAAEQKAQPATLSDEQIVKVLASLGIDATPSVYGFDALQVRTTVPGIREIVAAPAPHTAQSEQKDADK